MRVTVRCSRCRGRCFDFLLSGVSQLAFQRKLFPREDGQVEIRSKEVLWDSGGAGQGLLVSGFPWVFVFLSELPSGAMGSNASAAWSVCVG